MALGGTGAGSVCWGFGSGGWSQRNFSRLPISYGLGSRHWRLGSLHWRLWVGHEPHIIEHCVTYLVETPTEPAGRPGRLRLTRG